MSLYQAYPIVQRQLADAHAMSDASEAHGALTGALCAAAHYGLGDWTSELLPEGPVSATLRQTLEQLYTATGAALQAGDAAFAPLLPEEDATLEARTEALAMWCNGFLYGLGAGGAGDPARLPGEAGEFVRDLAEIARAGVEETDGQEANEAALAEIVEFVRVGVQIVYEELGALRDLPRPEQSALH